MEKNKSILIIDDDHFLLHMYSLKFKNEGFEAVTATEGNDALNKLREGLEPTVIMLDMVMPAMDGIEILTRIKKENLAPKSAIVVLSNQSQSTDIEKAKKLGVDGYIIKATTIPSEVVTEIEKIVKATAK